MVQGLVNKRLYHKENEDGKQTENRNNHYEVKGWLKIKWKLIITSTIILLSVLFFTGIILYLNIDSPNHCRKRFVNVHIIPYMQSNFHPYLSPEEYLLNDIYNSLDYVIVALENDEKRRFTLSEIHSFYKWWENQTDSVKKSVKTLIDQGRLEIGGGGWCVPDEASTYYRSFIDEFTLGLRCLEEIAGRQVSPDVSFLMDNHGHSREIASLLNEMDFRAIMLGGIPRQEQCRRRTYHKMEFLWSDREIFPTGKEKPNLFASILDERALKINRYFEYENPIIDMEEFYNSVMCQAFGYGSNHVFIPIGNNFNFRNIKNTFNIVELLMNLTEYNPIYKINVNYSTPSNYIKSVEGSSERWTRSNGEFVPYPEGEKYFRTGYYSSRACLKYLERISDGFLQVLKQILSTSNSGSQFSEGLNELQKAVGLSQHHKGVAGVANQKTADYMYQVLHKSVSEANEDASTAINEIAAKNSEAPRLNYQSCLTLNISECGVPEKSEKFILTIYNPLNIPLDHYVRIPVMRDEYVVRSGDGVVHATQIVNISERILFIPGRRGKAKKELVFRAEGIPAVGFKSYYISAEAVNRAESVSEKNIGVQFDEETGKLAGIRRNNETYHLSQDYLSYSSWFSTNAVFSPISAPQSITSKVKKEILNDGELVTEYKQDFGRWASQIIRIYKDEDYIEFKWTIGPISMPNEIVTCFTTNIKNDKVFYAGANGRGLNKKGGAQLENENVGEYLARNYHPIDSHISIRDADCQLHVFNDRLQGGTGAFEGQIEIMIHRRLLGLNVFEKSDVELNEKAYGKELIVSGRHWVFLGSSKDLKLKKSVDNFAMRSHWEPWYFFSDASDVSYQEWTKNYLTEFSGIKNELPTNLRILTLEPWKNGQLLLRLENFAKENGERIEVNLQELFSRFTIENAYQVTLAGNGYKNPFTSTNKITSNPSVPNEEGIQLSNFQIFIDPSQIKTFVIDIKKPLH